MNIPFNVPPQLMEDIKDGLFKNLGWGPMFKKALETLNKKMGPLTLEDGEVRIGRVDRVLPSELPHVVIVKKNDYDDFASKYFAHWEMHYQLQVPDEEPLGEHVYWSSQWRFKVYRMTDTFSEVQVPCVCCDRMVAQAHSMTREEFAVIMGMAAAVQGRPCNTFSPSTKPPIMCTCLATSTCRFARSATSPCAATWCACWLTTASASLCRPWRNLRMPSTTRTWTPRRRCTGSNSLVKTLNKIPLLPTGLLG